MRYVTCFQDIVNSHIIGLLKFRLVFEVSYSIHRWINDNELRLSALVETWHEPEPDLFSASGLSQCESGTTTTRLFDVAKNKQ
jgi:hypothetical protein